MALAVLIAGRYSSTWNSLGLGLAKNGYELLGEAMLQDVSPSDFWGDTVIDGIFRGTGWRMAADFMEYTNATVAAAYPWSSFLGGGMESIGFLASALAKSLVLTATAGTPAVAAPATLTATKALADKGNNVKLLFDSRLREVPVLWRLYPADVGGGTIRFFALT